jgi:hypothetical protein
MVSPAESERVGTDAERGRTGPRFKPALALTLSVVELFAAGLLVAACGSGQPSSAAPSTSCAQVSATLSDGPDPGSDPIGYAEAQVRPLRALRIADGALRTAVGRLADAYGAVFTSNDTSAAARSRLEAAVAALNKLCPDSGAGA